MKAKLIFTQLIAFVTTFLVSAVLSYLVALKNFFPLRPPVRQEAMWLMARKHGSDLEKLQTALEEITNENHAFASYERVAIAAQIEVITSGNLGEAVSRQFCETLKWQRCDKAQIQAALKALFGEEG